MGSVINLTSAKNAKNDEFYTQYHDIEKEINAYIEYNPDVFRNKTVLLPCDDPEWSNFTKFFAQNFVRFGLKKLISTSYAAESKNYKIPYQPSLFEVNDPQIKELKMWFGPSIKSGDREFQVPDAYPIEAAGWRIDDAGRKFLRIKGVRWFTNLDHGLRHQPLTLMTLADNLKYSKHKEIKGRESYDRYDNYDAIEVPFTDAIPSDFDGIMGVPISFLDKYSPEQFEIIGYEKSYHLRTKIYPNQIQIDKNGKRSNVTKLNDGAAIKVSTQPDEMTYYEVDNEYYVQSYKRIFIKHRKTTV